MKKVLALISGGLDSLLSAKLIIKQGLHVEGINFYTGFAGDQPCLAKGAVNKLFSARWIGEQLGIKIHVVEIVEEFKKILTNPKYGYGAHLNPCLDCKVLMVNQAKKWCDENNFDFIITGEVLGQRPKSQRKDTLPIVAQNSDDLLLRPLSAKLLAPTLPERKGWVEREELCGISGRSRKPQIELAKKLGITIYPQPAGGCVLTDENFCKRLKDLWQNKSHKDYSLDEITLLKCGRHIHTKTNLNLIIGRDENDNSILEKYLSKYCSLHLANNAPGPTTLIVEGELTSQNLELAARITARFCKNRNEENVAIKVMNINGNTKILNVKPLAVNELV